MPQTEEAISHARAAEVPIIVALNKIDLPSANLDKAMNDLSNNGLLPAEWGGDVEVVKTSAETGEGIDELLETILITSEWHIASWRCGCLRSCVWTHQGNVRYVTPKSKSYRGKTVDARQHYWFERRSRCW